MAADHLVMQEAMASAGMVLIYLVSGNPASIPVHLIPIIIHGFMLQLKQWKMDMRLTLVVIYPTKILPFIVS